MCENSRDALDPFECHAGNAGLDAIEPPWHNRYLHESEVQDGIFENADIIRIEDFIPIITLSAGLFMRGEAGRKGSVVRQPFK